MAGADTVLDTLRRHLLVDGFDLVLDLQRSQGSWLVDARDGTRYLDMFTFFASSALGMNHPALADDRAFREHIGRVALSKPSNSDVYTVELADFVRTFERVLGDPQLPYLFLIEGGALAVENALKAAFDWKRQHNVAASRDPEAGTRVLHLRGAFHGRTGYTMSLTNTEPVKTARFPVFDWPRIDAPAVRFPLDGHLEEVVEDERHALSQAQAAFAAYPDDIACVIVEPIQGEGGDNHFRAEFLQALQQLAHDRDALFVCDEVQTGCGLTGTAWAYQQLGLTPDLVAFGKKLQVCGVMAGRRLDEVPDHVFRVSGRLNSTWGGNLTDIVRTTRILETIESDGLIEHAVRAGKHLLERLTQVAANHPGVISNVRGRGLMCAVDLPDEATRDSVKSTLWDQHRVAILGCGSRSLRLRPALTVSDKELDLACDALDLAVAGVRG